MSLNGRSNEHNLRRFYLHSDGGANSLAGDGWLDQNKPKDDEATDSFIFDPLNPVPTIGGAVLGPRSGMFAQTIVEARKDVLVYSTKSLEESVEVTGPVKVVLYVRSSAQSTDFTAKLVDVFPDGTAYNLSDGIVRGVYEKDKTSEITIELWPTSNLFKRGHKIRIEISSSNYPRYNVNPNTGEYIPTATKTLLATQKIFHTATYSSRIVLPVIPRKR